MQWSSSAQNRAGGIKARCTSTQAEYNNNNTGGPRREVTAAFFSLFKPHNTESAMQASKKGICWRLFLISCLFLESSCQEFGAQTQFICTSVPKDMDICAATLQNSVPGEDLKTTVMQLRETVLQQKETIMNQKETIRELTSKLARCESQSGGVEPGDARAGGRRKEAGTKNTMGDVSRGPTDTLTQLSQTLQSLKQRLENLEVGWRAFGTLWMTQLNLRH